jgi:hypothetical protein
MSAVNTNQQQQQQETRKKIKKGPNPRKPVYGSYLHTLMKQINPEVSISSEAMLTIDAFVVDLETRLATKSFKMAKYDGKSTLKAKHVKAACFNMFRGDLTKVVVAEGEKALSKFNSA